MPDGDAFDGAYLRLAATRITPSPPRDDIPAPRPPASHRPPSSLLPRLTALAPKRRRIRIRDIIKD